MHGRDEWGRKRVDPPIYVLRAYLCPSLSLQQFCRLKSTRAEGSEISRHELMFAIAKARAVVVAGCKVYGINLYIHLGSCSKQSNTAGESCEKWLLPGAFASYV